VYSYLKPNFFPCAVGYVTGVYSHLKPNFFPYAVGYVTGTTTGTQIGYVTGAILHPRRRGGSL